MRTVGLSLVVASLLAAGTVPANADAFKPSKADQVKLGQRAATQIRSKEKVLPATDPKVVKLREVAKRLMDASPLPKNEPWQFSFDIVQDKTLNAFALPGGPIFFHSGLFDKFTTEDQLAGVLAHEMIHIRREHWAYSYADQQKRQLGLSLILIFGKVGKTAGNIMSISNDVLLTLPFMRKHETESDDRGFDMMAKAGFNPQGMADAFKLLIAGSKGGKQPEFISTHPDTTKRVKRIEERLAKEAKSYSSQVPMSFGSTTQIP